jgi:hypothetical protein
MTKRRPTTNTAQPEFLFVLPEPDAPAPDVFPVKMAKPRGQRGASKKEPVTGHLSPFAKAQRKHRAKMKAAGLARIEMKMPAYLKLRLEASAAEKEQTLSDLILEILKQHLQK